MQQMMHKFLSSIDRSAADENGLQTNAMTAASQLIKASAPGVKKILKLLLPAVLERSGPDKA